MHLLSKSLNLSPIPKFVALFVIVVSKEYAISGGPNVFTFGNLLSEPNGYFYLAEL